jgi:hypothetical protein
MLKTLIQVQRKKCTFIANITDTVGEVPPGSICPGPTLDKANLQAEQDTQGITTSIAGAEPPQKKSKLSLHRN